ncbi:hypothetical protein [uncultured Alsobacter sp.]|uniref:hypothetical protein n=1 Tax=uncultured Alsobacter sp. TaxID=1748258 RepID=UPI0025F1D8FF|nr:hypothetical protein [uncultured Alsobacter sp.]
MADIHDVENTLVSQIAAILYPNGTGQPSLTGDSARIFAGWPKPNDLNRDIPQGIVNVSVYTVAGASRRTTRLPREWKKITGPTTTLTVTVAGAGLTLGGTVSVPQNVHLTVNGTAFVYAVQAGDTLATIATAIATLTGGSSAGAAVSWSSSTRVAASIRGAGQALREIRRQEQRFQVSVWATSPAQRAAIGSAVDAGLAALNFLSMPDGSGARILYFGTSSIDTPELEGIYRRDIHFTVEYGTNQTETEYEIGNVTLNETVVPDLGSATTNAPTATLNTQRQAAGNVPPTYAQVNITPVAGVLTIDLALGQTFNVGPLTTDITSLVFLNRPLAGTNRRIELVVQQDNVGNRQIQRTAWPAGSQSASGLVPGLSATPNAKDLVVIELGATSTLVTFIGGAYSAFT